MALYDSMDIDSVDQESIKGELRETDSGRTRWVLRSKSKRVYKLVECPDCGGTAIGVSGGGTPDAPVMSYRCIMDNDCSFRFDRTL